MSYSSLQCSLLCIFNLEKNICTLHQKIEAKIDLESNMR